MDKQIVNIESLQCNQENPRYIYDQDFERLKKSLQDFPEMIEARPVLADENGVILAGNMRYMAQKAIGRKEIAVVYLKGLTEDKKKEVIIRDNVHAGYWDKAKLLDLFSEEEAVEFGVPDYIFDSPQPDYGALEEEAEEEQKPQQGGAKVIIVNVREEAYEEIKEMHDKLREIDPEQPGKVLVNALKEADNG